MGGLIDQDGLFIPWDVGPSFMEMGNGPLYRWVNFDEVANADYPNYQDADGTVTFTTMTEEVTDIQDFARILYRGPTNFAEWYFPARLRLDMAVASADYGPNHGLNYLHADDAQTLPRIELMAEDMPGYNHLDVLAAAVDRPGHRPNEVFAPMLEFVLANSGGKSTPGQESGIFPAGH